MRDSGGVGTMLAPVAGEQGDGRGQVAAGAVAADREPGGVDAKLSRVRRDPPRARVAVLHGGGELVLGRQPVARPPR